MLFVALCLAATVSGPAGAVARSWKVDPAASTLVVHVWPAGALAGTLHEHFFHPQRWRGVVRGDPARPSSAKVEIVVQADSLRDEQPALSAEDRGKVEAQVRGPRILDAGRFPEIVYTADRLEVSEQSESRLQGTLVGTLSLHGQTWGLRVPIQARWNGNTLVAEGAVTFRQSDFGIAPYRRFLGAVSTRDEVQVRFRTVAYADGR